jgi:dolichyl-phosphate-mannose-protein mannosyltransferase
MAADKAALASGADLGDGLRKRQAASQAVPSFIPAQTEDTKKLAKKV